MASEPETQQCGVNALNEEHVQSGGTLIDVSDADWLKDFVLTGTTNGDQYIDDFFDMSALAIDDGHIVAELTLLRLNGRIKHLRCSQKWSKH